MYLPPEIQYMIIELIPHSNYLTVSREWNSEIKNIQKKAANTIGAWYKKKSKYMYNSVPHLVRYYVIHYPDEFFIGYPEFTVSKLNLEEELLSVLPPIKDRKRSDVRDWMLNIPLDLHDWIVVGW